MSEAEKKAWRLDALDAVGGLAFASFRISDVDATALDAGIPATFIGAPTFQPMHLTSRSPGLAASRRSFQAGLFIDSQEVGFPDLEDVIEFVRRCYFRGGGGGGTPPDGRLPPAPDGGPEFPERPEFEEPRGGEEIDAKGTRVREVLRDDLHRYSSQSTALASKPVGTSFSMTWTQPSGPLPKITGSMTASIPSVDGADVLSRGAMHVLDEIIRRAPARSQDSEELMNWLVVYRRFAFACYKMGISPLSSNQFGYLRSMLDVLRRFTAQHGSPSLSELLDDLPIMGEWTDAMDDLHQWPMPRRIGAKLASDANKHNPTLLNFLAGFLANPADLDHSPVTPDVDIALFAAARIIAPSARDWAGDSRYPFDVFARSAFRRHMLIRLADTAWDWLVKQLPRRGFGPELEQAIEQTSTLVAA
jgi:hypothetical protein